MSQGAEMRADRLARDSNGGWTGLGWKFAGSGSGPGTGGGGGQVSGTAAPAPAAKGAAGSDVPSLSAVSSPTNWSLLWWAAAGLALWWLWRRGLIQKAWQKVKGS